MKNILDKLNKNGIENVRVDITTDINEYNEIEITAVRVYLTKTSDRGLVEKLIAEDLLILKLSCRRNKRC